MSGHSKWSKIKRYKEASDVKRGKVFSKIIKEITIAVREGGGNAEFNPRLRLAIANAKGANMPKENIQRAINKASETGGSNLIEANYEGYAPGGVGVFIECLTDNHNRTTSNIRALFSKYGGNLGTNGSLNYLFERKGVFTFPKNKLNEDEITLELIEAGAEDIELEDGIFTVYTPMKDFGAMQKKLEEMKIEPQTSELQRMPNKRIMLDIENAQKVLKLISVFEEEDDVQNVYHNLEMTDELMKALNK